MSYTYQPIILDPAKKIDLSLEGGGSLGAAYCGSLMALAFNGIWPTRVAGNSAGSITGSLIAAGYNANEIDYLFAPKELNLDPPSKTCEDLGPHFLDYNKFLDFPLSAADISLETKRNSIPYHLMKFIVDGFFLTDVSVPNLTQLLDNLIDKLTSKWPKNLPATIPDTDKEMDFTSRVWKNDFDLSNPGAGHWVDGPSVKVIVPKGTFISGTIPIPQPDINLLNQLRNELNVVVTPIYNTLNNLKNRWTTFINPSTKQQAMDELFDSMINDVLDHGDDIIGKGIKTTGIGSTATTIDPHGTPAVIIGALWDPRRLIIRSFLNLTGDGGLFKGDEFLRRMRRVLQAKVNIDKGRDISTPVLFKDLRMEFACVATNITDQEIIIYSLKDSPEYEVALAVRQSMSVPFVWEPVKERNKNGDLIEVWDGGICDNFPIWYNVRESTSDADLAKPKIAMHLNCGSRPQESCPGINEAGWPQSPHELMSIAVNDGPVPSPLALVDFGKYLVESKVPNGKSPSAPNIPFSEGNLINRLAAFGSLKGEANQYKIRKEIIEGYIQSKKTNTKLIEIPMKGFFWLDPMVDKTTFRAMACRGFEAVIWNLKKIKGSSDPSDLALIGIVDPKFIDTNNIYKTI